MATPAQEISAVRSPLAWFGEFLKEELAPYSGRGALVARMVIAATLVMLIGMTFRIPYSFQGAIYALMISRENSRATLKSGLTILVLTGIGAAYLLISACFVINEPSLHLFWVIVSFFFAFYAIGTLNNFGASSTLAIVISVGVPIWDRHVSAETNVEDTLWLCLASAIGIVVTITVELLFSRMKPGEDILAGLAERLGAVQNFLLCYVDVRPGRRLTEAKVTHLAVVGTSMLRRILQRSAYSQHYAEQMGAMIGLTGTLVDLAANLPTFQLSEDDRKQIRRLAENVGSFRSDLLGGRTPHLRELPAAQGNALHSTPLLPEMERTVKLMDDILTGSPSLNIATLRPSSGDPPPTFFVRDAFTNVDHIKFAVKGCLTASICYIIYNAIDWPGISTAVTTCFLTALTTIGSSRQKQVLRISGAVVGGFVLGMGSQIFILPYLDSIAGFTILFMLVTAFASWFMTSSPRLSYFGMQVALAFYLIHLRTFAIESSLSIARDRVVGILVGLVMMWLIFDQLWGATALLQMKNAFISALRLLAQFSREPLSRDLKVAIERSYSLREAINKSFDSVRASADAVVFEFGPSRKQDLALRSRLREWQPQLRALFLMRIALWKYRVQLPGFTLPDPVRAAQQQFDYQSAMVLDDMADRLEGTPSLERGNLEDFFVELQKSVALCHSEKPLKSLAAEQQTFLALSRSVESLTTSLSKEMGPVLSSNSRTPWSAIANLGSAP
jgi:multidrug resistance protein MdtO